MALSKKSELGQSLFELVVAIGVVALILFALVALATLSVRNASFARNESEATRLAAEVAEWLRGERDKSWDLFIQQVTLVPIRCLENTSWEQVSPCGTGNKIAALFVREVRFTPTDEKGGDGLADRVEAVISVNWQDAQGAHIVTNSTYYTDWRVQ